MGGVAAGRPEQVLKGAVKLNLWDCAKKEGYRREAATPSATSTSRTSSYFYREMGVAGIAEEYAVVCNLAHNMPSPVTTITES